MGINKLGTASALAQMDELTGSRHRASDNSGSEGRYLLYPHRLIQGAFRVLSLTRDAAFRKMPNRNQTDTNEMATTETKYQTDFYSSEKYKQF